MGFGGEYTGFGSEYGGMFVGGGSVGHWNCSILFLG